MTAIENNKKDENYQILKKNLKILKSAKNSNIVGADLNELSPIKGFNSYNFLAAKLVYKILSYKFLY